VKGGLSPCAEKKKKERFFVQVTVTITKRQQIAVEGMQFPRSQTEIKVHEK
jgi:hypothetical protein